jgi:hypothetical protein
MKIKFMRNLKLLKKTLGVIAIVGGILTSGLMQTAHADNNDMGFSVQPTSENYSKIGYFKFTAKPNQTETLNVTITNTTNANQNINVGIQNALSSPAGNTQYTTKTKIKNAALTNQNYAMKKYVTGPTEIQLKPQEQKQVSYTVKLPDQSKVSTGSLLGGLSFENAATPKTATKKSPVTVYTKVARLISIEADYDQTKSNLKIDQPSISTNPSTPLILLPIQNKSVAIARKMQLNYTVKDANQKTVFTHTTNQNQSTIMAPATKINYMIPWQNKTFKPGKYTIDVNLKTKDQNIQKSYTFIVKNKNVKDYAKESKTKPIVKNHTNIWLIISLVGIIVILLVLLFRKKKHEKNDDKPKPHK